MDKKEFFKTLVYDMPMYTMFNAVRELMFKEMALHRRNPMTRDALKDLFEDADSMNHGISPEQVFMFHDKVADTDNIRYYYIEHDDLGIIYVVNMTSEGNKLDKNVASHMQQHFIREDNEGISSLSLIVLLERHHALRPVQYPKVIKHELCHAIIEHLIKNHSDLQEFYDREENDNFIELMCNVIPYLSVPVRKENGFDKFIEDSVVIFGYKDEDAEDNDMLEDLAIIQEVEASMKADDSAETV